MTLDIKLNDSYEVMKQADMTAHDYMSWAIENIDRQLGDGYAINHPGLIGAYMRTAAQDFHTSTMKAAYQDIRDELRDIHGSLDSISSSIDNISKQIRNIGNDG